MNQRRGRDPGIKLAQMVKRLPTMHETRVPSLGWEDLLEKGMATHSRILAIDNPMEREGWRARVQGVTESQTRWRRLSRHAHKE